MAILQLWRWKFSQRETV